MLDTVHRRCYLRVDTVYIAVWPQSKRRSCHAGSAYLFFDGRCEEAIEFYPTTLGAEVTMLMRWKDSPEPCPEGAIPPG